MTDSMASALDSSTPTVAAFGRARWRHWLLIMACGLYCHWALLTNDGVYWDGWWLRTWLISGNWQVNHEFFSAVGMPLYAYVNWAFAGFSDPVPAMMVTTVGCFLIIGLLIYELCWRSGWLTAEEGLAVAVLSMSYPVFLAAQDIIMLFFLFTYTVFLASVLAALQSMNSAGGRAMAWRGLALVGLFTAGSNAGLLAFQGVSFAFLCACWIRRRPDETWWRKAVMFTIRHLDFLFLPFATWWFRHTFTPQFGAYANYNHPKFNPLWWRLRFDQFLTTTLEHLETALAWLTDRPERWLLAGLLLAAWWRWARSAWMFRPGPARTRWLIVGGLMGLGLGILPYVAAGKSLTTVGLGSRTGLLLGLPAGLLLFASLRGTLTLRPGRQQVLWWPLVILCAGLLGRKFTEAYLWERGHWIQSRALIELVAEDPLVRGSSYVRFEHGGAAATAEVTYLTYALAATQRPPTRQFATARSPHALVHPDEIEHWLVRISGLLPSEALHINPAGSQVDVDYTLPRWPGTTWELLWRYLQSRQSADPKHWLQLRDQLAKVETRVARAEVPLVLGPARQALPPSPSATGDFVNGVGMTMIRVDSIGWAGQCEVTQHEYQQIMGTNPSRFRDPVRPVECVNWHEAREFCRRLTYAEAQAGRLPAGHLYTLPTEAVWLELAASPGEAAANHQNTDRWHTAPTGSQPANARGLYDMRGNVWEWCLEWADRTRHFRVLRGEAWSTARPAPSLTAARHGMRPDQALWHTGFRCVLLPKTSLPQEFQLIDSPPTVQ